MKNFLQKFRKFVGFPFVFLLVMILFLGVTLGTAGSTATTGDSFELQYTTDKNWSWVVFKVTAPMTEDEEGEKKEVPVRLHDVYLNVGTIYSEDQSAIMELQWGTASTEADGHWWTLSKMKKAVLYGGTPQGALEDSLTDAAAAGNNDYNYVYNASYRWIAPFGVDGLEETSTYRTLNSSPSYFKLVLPKVGSKYQNVNVLVNEIVFIGEVYEGNKGTGEYVVLPVEIDSRTFVPAEGKAEGDALAGALIDRQEMPSFSESTFHRYADEEVKMLMTLSEMKMGNRYVQDDHYHGDTTYNSLGLNLTYLGTLIFGMSPFGVRFFNVLASFGILAVGFFLVRSLFKSDKAGLLFAFIYALSGVAMSLAHLASPIMLGVFFLLASLYACHHYYAKGMKKSSALDTLPLLFAGIAGALAILVNGAFVIPVAGVAALFVVGVIKQYKKNRARLDEAIAFAEEEKAQGIPAVSEDGTESEGNRKVRTALNKYRYDTTAAISVFACSLILGVFVLSILLALPVSFATIKIYDGTFSGTSPNVFKVAFRLFAAGFASDGICGWNYIYPIFTGTGERYAVTLGIMNFAATLLGLIGLMFAIYRIVTLVKNKAAIGEYASVIIPLAGLVLSLVTGAFAGGAIAFVLLANLFAFMLVSGGDELFAKEGAKQAKAAFIIKTVSLALLALCFALTAVFTFSIPLPASFMAKIF
ncbi:MAG: phospholipid carrier-dependent glycosyltransferase [Clostridia bacterium]|nr:phospholipid carrier-dependent glycosyltransferase [Clostridia bacterium]